jgi:hypothetical protein
MGLDIDVVIGAVTNVAGLALAPGETVSFDDDFEPSARGCNEPEKPTTFGPLRRCIEAMIFRSMGVKWATFIDRDTIMIAVRDTFSVIVVIFFASRNNQSLLASFRKMGPISDPRGRLPVSRLSRHSFRRNR